MVVVLIKSFERAKGRLADRLDASERRELAESMATTVLAAADADGLSVLVVTDDDAVERWARGRGALVSRPSQNGLDAAALEGVGAARRLGFRVAVIAHADLPFATTFRHVADRSEEIVIVPDRHGDGTNVIAVAVDAGFAFSYGVGSFARHRAEAERLGRSVAVIDDPDLAWDVDEPGDLPDRAAETGRST